MVQAILDGRKTMTRRIMKFKSLDPAAIGAIHPDGSGKGWIAWQPGKNVTPEDTKEAYPGEVGFKCPHGAVGDVLWVRETWCWPEFLGPEDRGYIYKASENGQLWQDSSQDWTWRPSIFMPKAACRIFLEIADIRVERLQDITEVDAIAEGVQLLFPGCTMGYRSYAVADGGKGVFPYISFKTLWQKINGHESWEDNPWSWVVSFKQIDKPKGFK